MNTRELKQLERELEAYVDELTEGMGRVERRRAMRLYVTGLLLEGERKSIEPIAARLVDGQEHVEGMRQRLQECVSVSAWDEQEIYRRIALQLDSKLPDAEALVVDDTGFPKKGEHSVGVARQYSGTLGRTDNCQVAVSLHLAGEQGSGCIGMRLYLPEAWASDAARREKARVPDDVTFKTKWQLALDALDDALGWKLGARTVLADAGYGDVGEFRDGLVARGLNYVVGIQGTPVVWAPGTGPTPPPERTPGRRGAKPTKWRDGDQQPLTIRELATSIGRKAYRRVTWRQGSRGKQASRFAALRIRTAHRHVQGEPPGAEQWLFCEWPVGEKEPKKFYLSNLPATTSVTELVRLAKLRWRIERDYQEMKGELGLDHFEGRQWRGFHHHAALCAAAHAFLALRRALSPPEPHTVDPADGQTATPAGAPA